MKTLNKIVAIGLIVAESVIPLKMTNALVGLEAGPKEKPHYRIVNIPVTVTNQKIINYFYKIGKGINPKEPWEYMAKMGFSLDEIIAKGRNNNYSGKKLPEEIMRQKRWVYIGNDIYQQEKAGPKMLN